MKRWPTVTLGEIAGRGQYGLNTPAMSEGTGIRFVRITDITQAGELRHEEPAFVLEGTPDLNNYELRDGDVLIARSGATAGKSYIHHPFGERAVFAEYLIRFQPDASKVLPHFIRAFLQTPDYWRQLNSHKRAVAQPNVNAKQLASLVMPVPPLVEQERLVKLLDEADELRKLRAQADCRTDALIPSLFHEMFCENVKKPHYRVKLEQIGEVVSGVAKGRKFNGRQPVEVPYLRVANVQAGHLDLSEIKTIQALPEEVEELALRKGDVLLTEGGDFDKLGRGAMLEQDLPNCIHQNHVFRVRVEQSKLNPVYFARFLLTGEARQYFLGCAKRTTNLASINMTQLRALPVLLPPLTLQKELPAARLKSVPYKSSKLPAAAGWMTFSSPCCTARSMENYDKCARKGVGSLSATNAT